MALRCYSFARTGEDAAYLAFDIPLEQVEQGLAALKTLGAGGAATAICVQAAVGGIGMLLWQGVAAFRLFTGKDMPAQEVLEKFFS